MDIDTIKLIAVAATIIGGTVGPAFAIGKIGAKETYFTHMSHDMGLHNEMNRMLPEHIQLAFDGLKLNI